ncbi:unnamed protein product [Prunus armeniaca]
MTDCHSKPYALAATSASQPHKTSGNLHHGPVASVVPPHCSITRTSLQPKALWPNLATTMAPLPYKVELPITTIPQPPTLARSWNNFNHSLICCRAQSALPGTPLMKP